MATCSNCELFDMWQSGFQTYSQEALDRLTPYVLPTMSALLFLYWTFRITRHIAGAPVDFAEIGKELMFATIAVYFGTFPSHWQWLIGVALDTSVNLARAMIEPLGVSQETGLKALIAAIESPLDIILDSVQTMMGRLGYTAIPAIIGCMILLGVYFVFAVVILVEVVWGYSAFLFILVFGPIILIAYSVPFLRGLATQAWKICLTGMLALATLGLLTGISVSMLDKMVSYIPASASSDDIDAKTYVFSQAYFAALGCGFLLFFLKGRFMHLAAQLADSVTNGAPDVLGSLTNLARKFIPTGASK